MWKTRNQNYQVPRERRCDPEWRRCGLVWAFEQMKTVFVPLKRTQQETYFRKHWYVYFCCSYIWVTPPGSGLLSPWIYIYIFFFFQRKGISAWLFIIIYIFLFILKIIASVKNQHNLYFAVELQMGELQWTPRYREYKIFAVDLRLSSTFLLLKFVCCCFLVSRERKLVLLKSNVILLD